MQLTITVSQLNTYLKSVIESDKKLSDIFIKGEISNFTHHYKSGHLYFTLKDSQASLRVVMFNSYAQQLKFLPDNAMNVIVRGSVSVYERDGVYQLYAREIQPDGIGALYLAYEQLKNKLQAQGLFAPEHKKPLPAYPKHIGIIAGADSAALADMLSIIQRRYPIAKVTVYPALVQGIGAPQSLQNGIAHFEAHPGCDVLIIGRGGGSLEDLYAFNDEGLARAIYACGIPVVSAVGHQTDYTIADFVADLRAPTPSAAAELVTPDLTRVVYQLAHYQTLFKEAVSGCLYEQKQRLRQAVQSPVFQNPQGYIAPYWQRLENSAQSIRQSMLLQIKQQQNRLYSITGVLHALSPLQVLGRGFALIKGETGYIGSIEGLHTGQSVQLILQGGSAQAVIADVKKDEVQ